jgi:hypothetical protein
MDFVLDDINTLFRAKTTDDTSHPFNKVISANDEAVNKEAVALQFSEAQLKDLNDKLMLISTERRT